MLFAVLSMALLAQPALKAPACIAPASCLVRIGQPHPSVTDGAVLIGMGETMVVLLDETAAIRNWSPPARRLPSGRCSPGNCASP